MLNNQVPKSKPQERVGAQSQGTSTKRYNYSNSTTNGQLKDSRSRYDKGMELYREGKVKVGANGLFKVSGFYEADTERMTCTCPDYRTRKESCKHLFAAMLFVKNRGKQTIEHLDGNGKNQVNTNVNLNEPANKPQEAVNKPFDRQATITRLAVINSAIEALKTHRKPIELNDIVSLASQLEQWALGGD